MRMLFVAAILLLGATATGALADTVAFVGPASWSHSPPSGATDATRMVDQWHISGDVSTLTFIKDSSSAYSDALGAIEKNFSTNNIKASMDRDVPCRGITGHVVEFAYGPDGHRIVINRLLVPDGAGLDTITYARSDGSAFDPDVKTAEAAFCKAAS
jgi:hypothetical protein